MSLLVNAFRGLTARNPSLRNFHSSSIVRSEKTNNRRRILQVKYSKEPVFPASAEPPIRLPDGSLFVSRVPRPSKPVTMEMLPPVVNASKNNPEQAGKVSKETIKEIQQLWDSDPKTWSLAKLAKKYQTSCYYLNLKLTTPLSRQKEIQEQAETEWKESHYRRRLALINRQRRKEFW